MFLAPLTDVANALSQWLSGTVTQYVDEQSTPNLWESASVTAAVRDLIPQVADTQFTVAEQQRLIGAINELRRFIAEQFVPSVAQEERIEHSLQSLEAMLSNLSRSNWNTLAIGTIVTIANTLFLNNQQGHRLLAFAKELIVTAYRYYLP